MLDTNAEELTKAELPEILELLPAFAGKRVRSDLTFIFTFSFLEIAHF